MHCKSLFTDLPVFMFTSVSGREDSEAVDVASVDETKRESSSLSAVKTALKLLRELKLISYLAQKYRVSQK